MRKDLSTDMTHHIANSAEISDVHGVVVNDNHCPAGRIASEEAIRRAEGKDRRDALRDALALHKMEQPQKKNRMAI